MLHVPQFLATCTPPPVAGVKLPPIAPAEYLALRRAASGLTIDQVAARILASYQFGKKMGKSAARAEILALLRLAERRGVVVRDKETLDRIRRGYDFDPHVYRQLATAPAKRLPKICRGCGCSDHDPCHSADMNPCRWTGPATCSRCTYGEDE